MITENYILCVRMQITNKDKVSIALKGETSNRPA